MIAFWFDLLVALFPQPFREAFAAEMREVFAAQLIAARARGRAATLLLVARTSIRMIAAAWRERRTEDRWRPGQAFFGFGSDLRVAARTVRQRPGWSVAIVAAIAIGVGAVATIFSAVNAMMLRPLPGTRDGDALVGIERRSPDLGEGASISFLLFDQVRRSATSLAGAAAWTRVALAISPDGGDGALVAGALVSSNYFDVLGIQPARGRFFVAGDDTRPLAEPEVVVSFDFWRRHLDGNEAATGRQLRVNGRPYRVAGVAPQGFRGVFTPLKIDAWVPLSTQPHVRPQRDYGHAPSLWMFGRLRVDRDAARAELTQLFTAWAQTSPESAAIRSYSAARLTPLTGLPDDARRTLFGFSAVLMGAALLVLLIAAANASSLLATRAMARRRELSVRAALGASRGRLVRQLLTETLLLFTLGAIGGVGVAWLGTAALERVPLPGDAALSLELSPDFRVVLLALATALAAGLVAGVGPALAGTTRHPSSMLRNGSAAATRRIRATHVLLVAQLAASIVLLAVAGLFARALGHGASSDPGFAPAGVLAMKVNTEAFGYDDDRSAVFLAALRDRVTAIPGVTSTAYTAVLPLTETPSSAMMTTAGSSADAGPALRVMTGAVSDGYFETLQIPILSGRGFQPNDRRAVADTAVISEALATRAFPGGAAVGQIIRIGARTLTVIGVVRDTRIVALDEPPALFVYQPLTTARQSSLTLFVRTADRSATAAASVGAVVRAIDPSLPRPAVTRLAEDIAHALLPQRVGAFVTGTLGLGGLTLAAIGLYGALAFAVSSRTRELGVRLALGAREYDVVALMARQGLALTATGIAIGAAIAIVAARATASYLLGVSPFDGVALGGAATIFVVVALLATWIPARRAAFADPVAIMKAD